MLFSNRATARLEVETDEFPYLPTRQGGVESTVLPTVFLQRLLLDLDARFAEFGGRIDLDGLGRVSCLAWSGNLYFVADSAVVVRQMLDVAVQELFRRGIKLKADEMFLLRSDVATRPSADIAHTLYPGDGRMDMVKVEDLSVLGMILLRDPAYVVRARLLRAEGEFWAMSDYWKRASSSMEGNSEDFAKRVRLCAMFGAATWTWMSETTGMLLSWENKMLCRMLGAGMRPGESWAEFQTRRVNSARHTFHASGRKSLLTEALMRQFSLVRKSFSDYTPSTRRMGEG